MKKQPSTPRLHMFRRSAEELSDAQIERLMVVGRREAELIDEIEAATRAGDRNLLWQLAEALVRCQDEAKQIAEARNK